MQSREKQTPQEDMQKKPYNSPELKVYGTVEKLTGWIGGPWGEFFSGVNQGWNPWGGDGGS